MSLNRCFKFSFQHQVDLIRFHFVVLICINTFFSTCRYAKLHDEDNWLSIDEKTAEIRLNKLPDRESAFLKNGTYYAEIVCISNGESSKKCCTLSSNWNILQITV